MDLGIGLASKEGSTDLKDLVISVLSIEWPLSAKQIHHKIVREHGKQVTYQAVHKVLKAMLSEGIIELKEKDYQLNIDWIKKVHFLSEQLEKTYLDKKTVFDPNKEVNNLAFNTLIEMYRFIVASLVLVPNPENKPGLCVWRHCWGMIGASNQEFGLIKKALTEKKHFSICNGNTVLDKAFSNTLEKLGKKNRLGVPCAIDCDTIIEGDYVAQIYYSEDIRRDLDKVFDKVKKIEDLDVSWFLENVLNRKTKITVIVTKNPDVADNLREQFLKHFKVKK